MLSANNYHLYKKLLYFNIFFNIDNKKKNLGEDIKTRADLFPLKLGHVHLYARFYLYIFYIYTDILIFCNFNNKKYINVLLYTRFCY
jgi:hypothetical protein